MRVLISPDDFTGTLTAAQAAEAIAAGWRWSAPDDVLTLLPLSDGGPGFVQVIASATDAEMVPVGVRGPMGETAIGVVAIVERTAYVESAHGCGLALVHPERRDAGAAASYGVGQLIAAAIDGGARTIVIGLGGTASTDGGAGMLAALGATGTRVHRSRSMQEAHVLRKLSLSTSRQCADDSTASRSSPPRMSTLRFSARTVPRADSRRRRVPIPRQSNISSSP